MKTLLIVITVIICSCKAGTSNSPDAAQDAAQDADLVFHPLDNFPSKVDTERDSGPSEEPPELPGALCQPCETNHDCKAGGGLCYMNLIRNETFCSICCGWTPCPNGFVCIPTNIWDPVPESFQCSPADPNIPCKSNYQEE